jgi:predicted O-methyltransferase YrrM
MQPQKVIDRIRQDRTVTSADGTAYPIRRHPIDAAEGRFLTDFIVSRPDIARTLEVGCAYGLSSLHIAAALAGRPRAQHIIVDPFQSTDWHGIGVANLDRAGVDFYELREEPSELVLPQLLRDGVEFDLVFIDGLHTFDQTMLDMYYANRLIAVGGYIILDDANWASVSKVVSYFSAYPCYEVVGGTSAPLPRLKNLAAKVLKPIAEGFPRRLYDLHYARAKYPTMMAFQKIADDERDEKWFRSF